MAGGERDNSVGYFVQPTVFADVAPDSTYYEEEIFGPVVGIAKAKISTKQSTLLTTRITD